MNEMKIENSTVLIEEDTKNTFVFIPKL